jgi:hypothetical protein
LEILSAKFVSGHGSESKRKWFRGAQSLNSAP